MQSKVVDIARAARCYEDCLECSTEKKAIHHPLVWIRPGRLGAHLLWTEQRPVNMRATLDDIHSASDSTAIASTVSMLAFAEACVVS